MLLTPSAGGRTLVLSASSLITRIAITLPILSSAIHAEQFSSILCIGSISERSLPQHWSSRNYHSIYDVCSATAGVSPNAGCGCHDQSGMLLCRNTVLPGEIYEELQRIQMRCYHQCECAKSSITNPATFKEPEEPEYLWTSEVLRMEDSQTAAVPHQCTAKCTGVSRQCQFSSDCTCHARPLSLFFWFTADCGPSKASAARLLAHEGELKTKRNVKETKTRQKFVSSKREKRIAPRPSGSSSRMSSYSSVVANHTVNTTALALAQAIVDGAVPAPCNESYVSYACANSSNGIVHEPKENWLGALMPINVTARPSIPSAWLELNGYSVEDQINNTISSLDD